MDTKHEDLLTKLGPLVNDPYVTQSVLAQANVSATEAEMQRVVHEANARQQQLDYERVLRNQVNTLAQKLQQGIASPSAFSEGTALTEDNLIREIDKMREEEEKAKKVADKKKRQKNANTLEKLLRHEFQKTKA